jgi:excisionase family DNA binding protein
MALKIFSAQDSTNPKSLHFVPDRDSPDSGYLVLLTTAEAAAFLGIKRETLAIWRCTKRYNLPFVRVGKRLIKYRKSDLIAFLEVQNSGVTDSGK